MRKRIQIPNVERDERIGSVFNYLFMVTAATEDMEGDVEWDFSKSSFFHPFFLAPLAIFKHRSNKNISCVNCPSYLNNYLKLIHFNEMYELMDKEQMEEYLNPYTEKTYTPVCKFSLADEKIDVLQSVFQNIIKNQTNYDIKIHTPLSYMLGEIVCNISQHSKGSYGYIYSQYLNKEKCINICIADDGITIHGSYKQSGKYLDEIGDNEAIALEHANNGYSTKAIPERGFGLPTTRKLLVEGMGGAFFELSGGAFYRYEGTNENYVILPKSIFWNGTIILMKIPVCVPDNFNIYKYIE